MSGSLAGLTELKVSPLRRIQYKDLFLTRTPFNTSSRSPRFWCSASSVAHIIIFTSTRLDLMTTTPAHNPGLLPPSLYLARLSLYGRCSTPLTVVDQAERFHQHHCGWRPAASRHLEERPAVRHLDAFFAMDLLTGAFQVPNSLCPSHPMGIGRGQPCQS